MSKKIIVGDMKYLTFLNENYPNATMLEVWDKENKRLNPEKIKDDTGSEMPKSSNNN